MVTKKAASSSVETLIDKGRQHYLIAPRRGKRAASLGLQPMSAGGMKSAITNLERTANCEVVRVLKPRRKLTTLSAMEEALEAYVVHMDEEYAQVLKQTAPANLIIEEDAYLSYGNYGANVLAPFKMQPRIGNLQTTEGIAINDIKIRIVGDGNAPIAGANISLEGDGFPSEGQTDKNGEVVLKLCTLPGGRARSLFVDPHKAYWTRYITAPPLSINDVNVIRLLSLAETIHGFPETYKFGWGQQLMGLDLFPDEFTGKGVKIAIIDSGADNQHPILRHIKNGVDLTNDGNTSTWADDTVGHGTHCSGVITGRSAEKMALRGFAPEADIYIFKVFPGGQFSSLLDALDHCIDLDVDVVNMSLGSPQISEAVEQKLEEAVENGVACIVAAGNSAGPVQYPAKSPNVLAVSAIGKVNEFPQKTWDSQTVVPGLVGQDGLFSPSFTCFGPEIAVCAPGVAVISSVPGNSFDAQSGTSMAAPHVTGFAALLLAHHPMFSSGPLRQRGYQRVAGLFNIIKNSCTPINFGPGRTGAGLPRLHGLIQVMQATPGEATQKAAAAQSRQEAGAAASALGAVQGQGAGAAFSQDDLAKQLGYALLSGNLGHLAAQSQLGGMAGVHPAQIVQPYAGGADLNQWMGLIALARAQGLIR